MIQIMLANAIIFLILIFLVTWFFVALAMYFIPLIIAQVRKHDNVIAIAILNTVLGWTFIGWLAALLWALNSDTNEDS